MEKRRIAILGSTGSIGRQALDVISQHRDLFEVELLTANNSSDLLIQQAIEFDANSVVICNEDRYQEVKDALDPHYIKVFAGMQSVCDLVTSDNIDIVLTSMVGFSGLSSTVAAVKAGKTIALANKETLVAAGKIVMDLASKHHARILPVDSEHSAVFQCLQGAGNQTVEKLLLTASGGPFFGKKKEELGSITVEQALKHPNWAMGKKITIDSSTLVNKGLEVMEAGWLFSLKPEQIEVVVQPKSIIHSMIQFNDGAVLAQLGTPDMKLPIQYALTYPDRVALSGARLDFFELQKIEFYRPDMETFRALALAYDAFSAGGSLPTVYNAANELAVALFLGHEISYIQITELIEKAMDAHKIISCPTLDEVLSTENETYEYIREQLR